MTMTAEEWQERLARADAAWQGADAAEGGSLFNDPPDGDYQGVVWAFDFIDSDRDGRPLKGGALLKIQVQVAHGPHQGKVTGELYSLEDPDRLPYTKGVLAILGVDVENTPLHAIYPGSDLLEGLLDVPVEFTVRRSKKTREDGSPYVNVYINKRLGGPLRSGQPPAPAAAAPAPSAEQIALGCICSPGQEHPQCPVHGIPF